MPQIEEHEHEKWEGYLIRQQQVQDIDSIWFDKTNRK